MLELDGQSPFTFVEGSLPILVSFPHNSSFIPQSLKRRFSESGRSSQDTDWFLDRLYDLDELKQASKIVAGFSRYVIDLNRPADNQSLYPGQTTTGLIPASCFDGSEIYLEAVPKEDEIDERIQHIWRPYHEKIESELDRLKHEFGYAVLIEAHSIKSRVPRLFEGTIPDFNVGTNNGLSCSPDLQDQIAGVLESQNDYSHVINGRFIGGYITRHFGSPEHKIHAVQFELSQATYLDEEAAQWDDVNATKVQTVFSKIMQAITQWQPN